MTLDTKIEDALRQLCEVALQDLAESNIPSLVFTLAPPGKAISDGATTITLDENGAELFRQVVAVLKGDRQVRLNASEREIQIEVRTAVFEGSQALEEGSFDPSAIAKSLVDRLTSGHTNWEIYFPISSLELPEHESIQLAGGDIKRLSDEDKKILKQQCSDICQSTQWRSEDKRISGVKDLIEDFEQIMDSSTYWFVYQVNGRPESALSLAKEAAMLGLDILLFWGILNGINPETSTIGFSGNGVSVVRSFQFVKDESFVLNGDRALTLVPYKLTRQAFERLVGLAEFHKMQEMSRAPTPTELQGKFLLAIQQFAEAARLPSANLKLVWYLSSMETLLAAESERNRHLKVKRRIRKLLGEKPSDLVGPLCDKRRRPVHYGQRNSISEDLISDVQLQQARKLAYLVIVSSIGKAEGLAEQLDFLRILDSE